MCPKDKSSNTPEPSKPERRPPALPPESAPGAEHHTGFVPPELPEDRPPPPPPPPKDGKE